MLPLLPRSLDPGSQSSMIVYVWTNFDARRYSVFPNRCIHLIFKIIKARFSEHSMNHFVHACNVLTMEVPCQVPVYFLVVGKKSSVHGWSVKDLVLINKKLRSTSLECFDTHVLYSDTICLQMSIYTTNRWTAYSWSSEWQKCVSTFTKLSVHSHGRFLRPIGFTRYVNSLEWKKSHRGFWGEKNFFFSMWLKTESQCYLNLIDGSVYLCSYFLRMLYTVNNNRDVIFSDNNYRKTKGKVLSCAGCGKSVA